MECQVRYIFFITVFLFSFYSHSEAYVQSFWNHSLSQFQSSTNNDILLKNINHFEKKLNQIKLTEHKDQELIMLLHLKAIFEELNLSKFKPQSCSAYESFLDIYFDPIRGQSSKVSPLIRQIKTLIIKPLCT